MPLEDSLLEVDNKNIHVTAVKRADDGNGIIVRYYNPSDKDENVRINARGKKVLCKMDESIIEEIEDNYKAKAKKIITVRIVK